MFYQFLSEKREITNEIESSIMLHFQIDCVSNCPDDYPFMVNESGVVRCMDKCPFGYSVSSSVQTKGMYLKRCTKDENSVLLVGILHMVHVEIR